VTAAKCFGLCLLFLLPLQTVAVVSDSWIHAPPKPIGDGTDYEAIGFGIYRGYGWCTHRSDPGWKKPYQDFDPQGYSEVIESRGPVVPDTNRPPLLPAWIGLTYHVLPRGPIAFTFIRLSLAGAIALGCALFCTWGWLLCRNSRSVWLQQNATFVAGITLLIACSERNLRNYATDFLTEPFALLGAASFMLSSWWATRNRSSYAFCMSGAIFGLLVHCRSLFVLWLPMLLVFLYSMTRCHSPISRRHTLGMSVCWSIGVIAVLMPWWIRNCLVLEDWMPLGTKGQTTLLGGYCDESLANAGEWQFAPERRLRERIQVESSSDFDPEKPDAWLDREKWIAREAWTEVQRWCGSHVSDIPRLVVQRMVTEWNPYSGKALLMKLFAIVGLFWLIRNDHQMLQWLLIPLLINTFWVAVLYSVGGRFLVPTYGCVYVLAAVGIAGMLDAFTELGTRREPQTA
jgi:hypothetical protein